MGRLTDYLLNNKQISKNSLADMLQAKEIRGYNPTLEDKTYEVFGMEPNLDRGNILPLPDDKGGLMAPQWLYDLARMVTLPAHAMQGGSYTMGDVTDMAMAITPASIAGSLATPAKAGFTDIGMGRGSGWNVGREKSNNAVMAEMSGEFSLDQAINKIKNVFSKKGIKLSDSEAKKVLGKPSSWHHTGRNFKETNYYDTSFLDKIDLSSLDDIKFLDENVLDVLLNKPNMAKLKQQAIQSGIYELKIKNPLINKSKKSLIEELNNLYKLRYPEDAHLFTLDSAMIQYKNVPKEDLVNFILNTQKELLK
jgi:hypothetical protein